MVINDDLGETKWCPGHGCQRHEVPVSGFYKNSSRDDGISVLCVACHNRDCAERKSRLRLQAIEKLGGRCSSPSCAVPGGMDDPRCLQFDHIAGGGSKRQRDGENGHRVIKAILAGSDEFQVLCANCNWIKKNEQSECVGDRVYERIVPVEREWAPGKGIGGGNSETGQAGLTSRSWGTLSEADKATIVAKRCATRATRRAELVMA